MIELIAGLAVRIVIRQEDGDGTVAAMDTTVLSADGDTCVLAQTEPPIDGPSAGEIVVTYVGSGQDGPARLGFSACVVCAEEYGQASGRPISAVRVRRKTGPAPFTARSYVRVSPTAATRVHLYVSAQKVEIVDLSLGGVKFAYDDALALAAHDIVALRFEMAGERHTVEARILRTPYGRGRLRHAVARFTGMTPRVEQALVRLTRTMERAARKT